MNIEQWLVFVAVWTAASVPLGPNALNCIAVSAAHGFARSLWSILGIVIAAIIFMTATAAGFAALLLANAELFAIVKFAGAGYLVWMGISLWRQSDKAPRLDQSGPGRPLKIVRRAVLISMSNPKAIFAYMAVFSQFLTPGDPLSGGLPVLVATALVILVAVYSGYAALGLGVGRLIGSARRLRWFNRGVGSFYIVAGIGLATADLRPQAGR